jgi:hypothetical protein
MRDSTRVSIAALFALALAGCGEHGGGNTASGARQTHFPGMVTAGGSTSGEVMKQSGEKVSAAMPAGTPGIPGGAGGTTSGPAMGGTTPGASVAGQAPKGAMAGERQISGEPSGAKGASGEAAPAAGTADERAQAGAATPQQTLPGQPAPAAAESKPAAKPDAAAQAQKEKQELAAKMDDVAAHWRSDAAKNGWPLHPATSVQPAAGIAASGAQAQSGASPAPAVRSEKSGNAAPSEDVKRPKAPGAI